jgi:hypothetical protein
MSTLPQGTIVVYPYLWHREYRRGETEGRKSRPVCVTLRFPHPRDGEETLALFALTTKVPGPDDHARGARARTQTAQNARPQLDHSGRVQS